MSPENKQRVVGVVVLVAFIALLIPFLFTSGVKKRHNPVVDEVIPALATEAAPVPVQETNNVTSPNLPNELQQQPVAVATPNALPDSNPVLPSVPGTELPQPQAVAAPVVAPEVLPTPPVDNQVAVVNETEVVAEPEKQVDVVKAKKPQTKGKAKKAKGKQKPKIVSKAKNVVGGSSSWSVQAGSFSDQARMRTLVSSLQAKGFSVYMQKITTSKGEMVRVLVGHEKDKANAAKIANQLKAIGINGRVVGNNK